MEAKQLTSHYMSSDSVSTETATQGNAAMKKANALRCTIQGILRQTKGAEMSF